MDFSPAESFLSVEDNASFKSLFSETCSPAALTATSSPPPSEVEDKKSDDKKPVKKRKSWGQELPVPTTNLPPRKRAKTEAEKEQRRIERVLRNRAAAQSSRERKRKEVEALEDEKQIIKDENVRLTARLADMEAERLTLHRRILAMAAEMSVFRSILGDKAPASVADDLSFDFSSPTDFELPQQQSTLDPTDLLAEIEASSSSETATEARDVTQHPAVSVNLLASASLVSPPLSLSHELDCVVNSPEIDSLFPESGCAIESDFLLFENTTDEPFNFDSIVSFDADTEQFRSEQFENAIAV